MNHKKTTVLIIGDSISMGYTPTVRSLLADEFVVGRNEGNARDSRNILANLDGYLDRTGDAAVVHFNCGLHDLRWLKERKAHQVPVGEYRENLGRIVSRLQATGARLIWARTTPVNDQPYPDGGLYRCQAYVEAYNAVADEVMAAAGLTVDDLHAAVIAAGKDECLKPDGVHMNDAAYQMLGEHVAEAIRCATR